MDKKQLKKIIKEAIESILNEDEEEINQMRDIVVNKIDEATDILKEKFDTNNIDVKKAIKHLELARNEVWYLNVRVRGSSGFPM